MDDHTRSPAGTGSGAVSERMQALLSRASEDQLVEQRAVSTSLTDLRNQVVAVADAVRGSASAGTVEQLRGEVAGSASEVRRTYAQLSERLETLAQQVEEVAASAAQAGQGSERLSVRVAALGADLTSVNGSVDEVAATVASFPDALASVQRDLAGMHDRVSPLGDVRSDLAALAARPGADVLAPELEALREQVAGSASRADLERATDGMVGAVMARLEPLLLRESVTPQALTAALAPVRGRTEELVEKLSPLSDRVGALDGRLVDLGQRIAEVGDAAGGVPALSTDLHRLTGRVEDLSSLRTQLSGLAERVTELAEQVSAPTVPVALAGLVADVEALGDRVSGIDVPTAERVASEVAPRVADRLAERLAPGVAEQVLTRLGPALVEQVASAAASQVLSGVASLVRESELASERRILAHVDEAVLALAEALLRRRRTIRPETMPSGALAEDPAPAAAEPSGAEASSDLARTLQDSALDTGVLDIDELDRSIAAAEAEAASGVGAAPAQPDLYDNDADEEVPSDPDQAAPEGPVSVPSGSTVADQADVAEGAALGEDPVGESPSGPDVGMVAVDTASDTGQPDPRGHAGVSGGAAPRRARNAVPPLPPVLPAEADSDLGHDGEDEDGRRRPWWRPGG